MERSFESFVESFQRRFFVFLVTRILFFACCARVSNFLVAPKVQDKGGFFVEMGNMKVQIIKMLKKLAFGNHRKIFSLLFADSQELMSRLKRADLSSVAAIKKGKDNSIEIKFVDRLRVLDKLCELNGVAGSDEKEQDLYQAIAGSVDRGGRHED
jgi:hypothetical protein